MSKRTAPGMCPARYSACASRFMVGRYQEPSTTTMSGASSRSASHSGETKGALGMAKPPFRLLVEVGRTIRKSRCRRSGAALRLRRALEVTQDSLELRPAEKNKANHDHRADQEHLIGGRGHNALGRCITVGLDRDDVGELHRADEAWRRG